MEHRVHILPQSRAQDGPVHGKIRGGPVRLKRGRAEAAGCEIIPGMHGLAHDITGMIRSSQGGGVRLRQGFSVKLPGRRLLD